MKRIVLGAVVVVLLAVGGLLVYLIRSLDALVESAIETYGSEMTGTAVRVGSVKIDLAEGRGTIRGVTIANPSGFSQSNAFRLGEITLDIDTGSLTVDPVRLDAIDIRAPEVRYEVDAMARSNLQVIADNLDRYGGGGGAAPAAEGEDAGPETRLKIKSFVFEKGRVAADTSAVGGKDASVELPPLRLSNVGGAQGMTGAELGQYALSAYMQQVIKAVGRSQLDDVIDKELGGAEGEAAKKLLNRFLD